MSESTAEQPELGGMPDPEPPRVLWLHLVEANPLAFAITCAMLNQVAAVPGVTELEIELFKKAAERVERMCKEQVGRCVFDEAWDEALNVRAAMHEAATELAKIEKTARYC